MPVGSIYSPGRYRIGCYSVQTVGMGCAIGEGVKTLDTTATITFKGKVETLEYADGTIAAVRIKIPKLERKHCDMAAFRAHPKYGSYANSDLFPAMLARIKREKLGDRDYLQLDNIPEGVSVDTTGFLAVVTFEV